MCGIFGIIASNNSKLEKDDFQSLVNSLFVLSEARGKESSGIAIRNTFTSEINVLKHSVPASELIQSSEYARFMFEATKGLFKDEALTNDIALIAHARLVTNGSKENNNNNQPVIKSNFVAVHNGIITNVNQLWNIHNELNREYEVDTEVFLAMLQDKINKNEYFDSVVQSVFDEIEGTVTTCVLNSTNDEVLLLTNNASLYFTYSKTHEVFVFASEEFILNSALNETGLKAKYNFENVEWSQPNSAMVIYSKTFWIQHFNIKEKTQKIAKQAAIHSYSIINKSPDDKIDLSKSQANSSSDKYYRIEKLLQFNLSAVSKLKRCSKCLLPESFPFIKYDASGECNYCNRYIVKKQGARENEFKELMKSYRSTNGKPDCIIPFSGGRDSSYGLHYIVKELGLHPITYTYDWGMVTDLARRNIARVCGKLGIENIIVSADIHMKRSNIKKNVEAWLKKPQLGMIPIFMAGDKQFFYYVNQIKKQTGIKLDIWSTNILENTDFKVGFCGISPNFDKTRPDYLPLSSKIGLAWYYGKNFITNPAYINSSLTDTIASFYSYYAEPRTHFYQLFDWIKWDENKIEQTLFNEYNWELSPDTTTSWRIGDGTAAFYNYIYYTVAGFSEFDTFRSNQIREGLITREQGLAFLEKENRPRFESLMWYFDTIGVDFEKAIKTVNSIPKLYNM
ncbi:MAG: hypothetical protein ACK5JC_08875 [Bacteroidota bacterium]|jgi:glucosamine--fructose-6-phosphate aminotransferase (isomerizing)